MLFPLGHGSTGGTQEKKCVNEWHPSRHEPRVPTGETDALTINANASYKTQKSKI